MAPVGQPPDKYYVTDKNSNKVNLHHAVVWRTISLYLCSR